MDEELRSFIREYKARVAEDKASLDQDPPYMEMRVGYSFETCMYSGCHIFILLFSHSCMSFVFSNKQHFKANLA
uniref:Uncharacterized protein n=1 Tax=Gadus morhua TaxID=8049 RepID=A0A8C5B039_GADMO